MKLQTKIPLTIAEHQIDHQSQLLLLGSCFSENIGKKLDCFKFQLVQNPFGILFHPLAIEKLVSKAVSGERYSKNDIFFLNERWHCFDSHSDLSDTSKEKVLRNLNKNLEKTNNQFTKATHILITLGTAWVYRRTKTGAIVANCHKMPQKDFSKELLSANEVVKSIENTIALVRSVNKKVQFVFTVSPIRHLKDGFVENQRSKAHLITALHELIEVPPMGARGLQYFPSYEIMMDELRDYRFYKADMVHPNQLAIDYIWEKFAEVWLAPKAHSVMKKVAEIQKGLDHRPFDERSEQHREFLASLEDKISYLQQEYPFMEF